LRGLAACRGILLWQMFWTKRAVATPISEQTGNIMSLRKRSSEGGEGPGRVRGEVTRRRIKTTARRLFATRGLDAVSIREIVRAAGQKNAGSVNYYFRSKDDLVKELILDVAKLLDDDHNRKLDELEAAGGPHSIRDIVSILITYPTMDGDHRKKDEYALRFLNMIMINHRDLMFGALEGGLDRGTRRCMVHLRDFARDLPAVLIQQRLMLIITYLFATASSLEASLDRPRSPRSLWGHPAALSNLIDTVEGILLQPASEETLHLLDQIPE
jgi:AcrR family transcriptional regulator